MAKHMEQATRGNAQALLEARRMFEKLIGTASPETANSRRMSRRQIKNVMNGLV